MATNLGKQFENKFKDDLESMDGIKSASVTVKLNDTTSSFYATTSENSVSVVLDFICFTNNTLFLLECKTHGGGTFPLKNLTQYEDLLREANKPGIRVGVILWMYEKDIDILYIPVKSIEKMINDGLKSFSVKLLEKDEYKIIKIPGKKKRKFIDTDYSILTTLQDGD